MLIEIEYKTLLNKILANRILLVEMMQENENLLRQNKIKIKTVYINDYENQKIKDNHNQYGIKCNNISHAIELENEILIKRINEIKLIIQTLKKENKIYNKNKSKKEYYLSAFIAAAEILLDDSAFIKIENKAVKLMQVKS